MTKEEIIEMVMQIGGCDRPEDDSPALKMFVTFAKLVAEHERERCAEICECSFNEKNDNFNYHATLIRARGEQE